MKSAPRQYELELPPRASALVESLRDVGYSLQTALADVVDNSITAGARQIELLADTHGEHPAIGILDDGLGMTEEELFEAMRPGTTNPRETRDPSDLGRFGLGLKTASFSQCRRLTVVTRRDDRISAAVWDLDKVAARDNWIVQVPDDPTKLRWVDMLGRSGTLVVWEKLDRPTAKSQGGSRGDFVRQLSVTARHIGFVFHRFLSGRGRVEVSLNGRAIEPIDPFHSHDGATQYHAEEQINLPTGQVKIRPITLPHHQKVSKSDWQKYAGPEGYVANQGFYLYRNRRLIVHGTWFRLARKLELTKLARVAIDIPNTMDEEWRIDVKKASAWPPAPVRKRLAKIVDRLVAASKRTYTERGRRQTTDDRLPVWNRIINKNLVSYDIAHEHAIIQIFQNGLAPDQVRDFERLLRLVASALPIDSLHHDVSANPDIVSAARLSKADIRDLASHVVQVLQAGGHSADGIRAAVRSADPFRTQWSDVHPFLDGLIGDFRDD